MPSCLSLICQLLISFLNFTTDYSFDEDYAVLGNNIENGSSVHWTTSLSQKNRMEGIPWIPNSKVNQLTNYSHKPCTMLRLQSIGEFESEVS